jgi:butyrate kinase
MEVHVRSRLLTVFDILTINPGSTSTKVVLFRDERQTSSAQFRHDLEELAACGPSIWDQFEFRSRVVREWAGAHVRHLSAVAATGGLFRPLRGGTYLVSPRMLDDASNHAQGEHASNLGCALAHSIAAAYGCNAYVVDPVSVDEFEPLARYSGHPAIQRRSLSHALSIHAIARRAAEQLSITLADSRLVIAHLGGGISVAPLRGGRIIDVNDASSDGPFSPERTGGLPLQRLIELCFSGDYSKRDMQRFVMGRGGLAAYLGTNSALEVERRILDGDEEARSVYEAMAYQIAKEIGAMATVLAGDVDAVVLAGGLACSPLLVNWIQERVSFIAPALVFTGEDEMLALAQGVLRVVRGLEPALEY